MITPPFAWREAFAKLGSSRAFRGRKDFSPTLQGPCQKAIRTAGELDLPAARDMGRADEAHWAGGWTSVHGIACLGRRRLLVLPRPCRDYRPAGRPTPWRSPRRADDGCARILKSASDYPKGDGRRFAEIPGRPFLAGAAGPGMLLGPIIGRSRNADGRGRSRAALHLSPPNCPPPPKRQTKNTKKAGGQKKHGRLQRSTWDAEERQKSH